MYIKKTKCPDTTDRKTRLLYNTVSSFAYQIIAIICSFILPRLILSSFGSEVNGLLSSKMQFLGFITLMELGVGAVVQSALYKPLAENDQDGISAILKSARRFFRSIALVLVLYVIFLCFAYNMN